MGVFLEQEDKIRSPIEIMYEGRNTLSNWGTEHVMFESPTLRINYKSRTLCPAFVIDMLSSGL
jgi:hypothetical protein